MKMPVFSIYLPTFRFLLIVSVFLLGGLAPADDTGADPMGNPSARMRKVLVLDPGHGGHDVGAGKSKDVFEKDVTLMFAGILAEKLKPAYTVHLTRSDDYALGLMHRPAVANHLEADLFLSIHAGASTLHNPSGMLIAFYDPQFRLKDPAATPKPVAPQKPPQLTPWDNTALDHKEKSRHIAELVKQKFLAHDRDMKIDILGMPLVVLEGANQPALLIEIAYLSNPADMRKLKDNDVMADYAGIIGAALDVYFSAEISRAEP